MTSYCRRPASFAAHERPTVGDTKFSFTGFNHLGWLRCDGSQLSKSEYALLYAVIGGTFGENGAFFNLPDPRGRVIGAMAAPGSHIDSNTGLPVIRNKGDRVGADTHTLTINQMPAHKHGSNDMTGSNNGSGYTTSNGIHAHGITDPGHAHAYVNQPYNHDVNQPVVSTGSADDRNENQTTGTSTTGISVQNAGEHNHYLGTTGGGNLHNNMQPTLFYGNLYIYSGKVNTGSFPYTTRSDLL